MMHDGGLVLAILLFILGVALLNVPILLFSFGILVAWCLQDADRWWSNK